MKLKRAKDRLEIKDASASGETTYMDVAFECKAMDDVDDGFFRFEGLAAAFGNKDRVSDVIEPGAFSKSLKKTTPVVLWQHNMRDPIGMPEEVKETPDGLFIRAKLPKDDTLVSGRVIPQIKVGSITTMSIGFRTKQYRIDQASQTRFLIEVDLKEVSLVTMEANPKAKITSYKNDPDGLEHNTPKILDVDDVKELKTKRQFEKTLRDSGAFSKKASTLLATFFQGEPDEEDAGTEAMDGLKNLSTTIEQVRIKNELQSLLIKLEKHNA